MGPHESEGLAGTVGSCCLVLTTLASLPSSPIKGEVGWLGEGTASLVPACRYPGRGRGGGGEEGGGVLCAG
jgi:hypothetical protein